MAAKKSAPTPAKTSARPKKSGPAPGKASARREREPPPAATGGLPGADAATQSLAYNQAAQLFHQGDFAAARPLFERAAAGPLLDMAHSARTYVRICERKCMQMAEQLQTAEDYYHYGLALLNQRLLEEAESRLARAVELSPESDHVHYALAIARGLRGEIQASVESLQQAIRLNPSNRKQARNDADFQELLRFPAIAAIVFPDRGA